MLIDGAIQYQQKHTHAQYSSILTHSPSHQSNPFTIPTQIKWLKFRDSIVIVARLMSLAHTLQPQTTLPRGWFHGAEQWYLRGWMVGNKPRFQGWYEPMGTICYQILTIHDSCCKCFYIFFQTTPPHTTKKKETKLLVSTPKSFSRKARHMILSAGHHPPAAMGFTDAIAFTTKTQKKDSRCTRIKDKNLKWYKTI